MTLATFELFERCHDGDEKPDFFKITSVFLEKAHHCRQRAQFIKPWI
jgi:hypothetical protein